MSLFVVSDHGCMCVVCQQRDFTGEYYSMFIFLYLIIMAYNFLLTNCTLYWYTLHSIIVIIIILLQIFPFYIVDNDSMKVRSQCITVMHTGTVLCVMHACSIDP